MGPIGYQPLGMLMHQPYSSKRPPALATSSPPLESHILHHISFHLALPRLIHLILSHI